jgi:SnoaL-like domain
MRNSAQPLPLPSRFPRDALALRSLGDSPTPRSIQFVDVHPFRAAWRTRDLDAFGDHLAADVVLYSPVITTPFRGRDAAIELYGVLFDAFGDFEITDEFAAGESQAFFWRGELGSRRIEGVDLIHLNGEGKISEVRVLIRPLVDIGTFAGAVGPPLAGRRGRIRAFALRLLALPLGAILALADFVASRLVVRR